MMTSMVSTQSSVASATGVVSSVVAMPTSAMASASAAPVVPVASATSAVASGIASILPIPTQVIGTAAAAAPTKRWVKWE